MEAIELLSCSALLDSNICPPKLSVNTSSNIRLPTVARNLNLKLIDNNFGKVVEVKEKDHIVIFSVFFFFQFLGLPTWSFAYN